MKKEEFINKFVEDLKWSQESMYRKEERAEEAYFIHLAEIWLKEIKPPQFGWWFDRGNPTDFCTNGTWRKLYYHPTIGFIHADSSNVIETHRDVRKMLNYRICESIAYGENELKTLIKTGSESW